MSAPVSGIGATFEGNDTRYLKPRSRTNACAASLVNHELYVARVVYLYDLCDLLITNPPTFTLEYNLFRFLRTPPYTAVIDQPLSAKITRNLTRSIGLGGFFN